MMFRAAQQGGAADRASSLAISAARPAADRHDAA